MKFSFQSEIETHLKSEIKNVRSVSGGSINETFCVHTINKKKYFVKINSNLPSTHFFSKEAKNLTLIQQSQTIRVPKVISENRNFLILEFIESESPSKSFWQNLAEDLYKLHNTHHTEFGLDFDNYIGATDQLNKMKSQWSEFFIEYRLDPQVRWAQTQLGSEAKLIEIYRSKKEKIKDILEGYRGKPCLIHGDLWSGNIICGKEQQAVIVDPACYYGDPEAEIAMTHLFGSFSPLFYEAYYNLLGRSPSVKRLEIYKLYHFLNHLHLFGRSYLNSCESIIDQL